MNVSKALAFALLIVAVIGGFLVYPMLPNTVPTHWNAAGQADGFGDAWVGAFAFPMIMALVFLIFIVIPKIAVFKQNLKAFEAQYWQMALVLQIFFGLFFIVTLLPNFDVNANYSQLFVLPLGFMFAAIGWLMPKFKRNFFVGIRTPWTLANDEVWDKTHELGGKLFMVAGILTILAALLIEQVVWVAVGTVLVAALAAVVYSFIVFKKTEKPSL